MNEAIDLKLFDTSPYPRSCPVVDPSKPSDGWERDATASFFLGKSNLDLSPNAFREFPYDYSSCHHWLCNEAFVFFLPGLMRLVLSDRGTDQTALLGDSLVNTFLRMASGEMSYRLQPIVEKYSEQQLGVIAQFLVEIARLDPYPISEKDPALTALRLFWGQFLPRTTTEK
ncbi:hypothetical protein [Hydrogenophaga sp.]|uniref:hypothetical protein n=1 Tax=Hydrogenophaga sp. TaxID=1904254 RepID=UPI002FC68C8F